MVRFNEHRWGKDSASSRKGTGAQTVALPHDHALVLFSGSGVRNPRYHHSSIRMAGKRQWHPCTYKTKAECWESPSGPVQAYLKSPQCQSRYCVTLLSYTLAWENLSSQPFLCFVFAGGGGGGWVGGRWGSLSRGCTGSRKLGYYLGKTSHEMGCPPHALQQLTPPHPNLDGPLRSGSFRSKTGWTVTLMAPNRVNSKMFTLVLVICCQIKFVVLSH